jgi:phosphoribosylamine-glycine ligase
MIIYNVTVNIEESIEQEWLQWMKDTHIPDVMKTGMFLSSKMTHVLVEEQMGGKTYSIQYTCENKETLDEYEQNYAPALQKDHNDKYQGKFVAFRTLLEVIHEL